MKNVSLRRYGSFNGLVLCHLELLTSAEKLQKLCYFFSKSLKVLVLLRLQCKLHVKIHWYEDMKNSP